MSAPYGGRFGDPAALQALAGTLRGLAGGVTDASVARRRFTDLEPGAFKGPLVDRWRTEGTSASRDLKEAALELRMIASELDEAAQLAAEGIRRQRAADAAAAEAERRRRVADAQGEGG